MMTDLTLLISAFRTYQSLFLKRNDIQAVDNKQSEEREERKVVWYLLSGKFPTYSKQITVKCLNNFGLWPSLTAAIILK